MSTSNSSGTAAGSSSSASRTRSEQPSSSQTPSDATAVKPQPPAYADTPHPPVVLEAYKNETQLSLIQSLMDADLSEPYSIFTYRYFIHQWPYLCFLAMSGGACVGAVVSKLEHTKRRVYRGYIAMLAVARHRRKDGVGTRLVRATIAAMHARDCEEVVLEAETTNIGALRLYSNLGFIRHKRLEKYYLNGNDAFRLMVRIRPRAAPRFHPLTPRHSCDCAPYPPPCSERPSRPKHVRTTSATPCKPNCNISLLRKLVSIPLQYANKLQSCDVDCRSLYLSHTQFIYPRSSS